MISGAPSKVPKGLWVPLRALESAHQSFEASSPKRGKHDKIDGNGKWAAGSSSSSSDSRSDGQGDDLVLLDLDAASLVKVRT